jgi:hypothetical protein
MSDAKKTIPNAGKKAVGAEIEARLTAFDEHREKLLDPLRKIHERGPKTKPFDANDVWRSLRFSAFIYLQREAEVSKEQTMMPAGDRAKMLRQLGSALRVARRKADEAMKTGHWFVEWAIANGNPDFTDPRIELYQNEFETRVARLKGLEEAAYQAAETVRKKRGRPQGTTVVPHDFILNLEHAYRDITKRNAGAGSGPFFRFVMEFLTALGRECSDETVIEAIKAARKREGSQWGRDYLTV